MWRGQPESSETGIDYASQQKDEAPTAEAHKMAVENIPHMPLQCNGWTRGVAGFTDLHRAVLSCHDIKLAIGRYTHTIDLRRQKRKQYA